MSKTNRREFLRKATAGSASVAASLAAAGLFPRRVPAKEFKRIYYRQFGSTGFMVSEMGFGAMNMRDPSLVNAAIDSGINYIDTAHSYMNGVNEQIVGKVMKDRRKDVFLTTKIKFYKQNIDIKDMPDMLTTSLKRLQTDHVDLVLLHVCDKRDEVLDDRLMKIFDDYRSKGQTRFIGVSTHENQTEVLNAAVESKFWEAVLTGYNYFSPPELTDAIKKTREAGLAIIAMKTLITTERPRKPYPDIRKDKSGKTTNQQALLKWILQDLYVDTIIPGIASFEQLEDDVDVMGMQLTYEDELLLRRFSQNTTGRYCRGVSGCTGCRDQCPKGVQICNLNRCLMYAIGYNNPGLAWENYRELPESSRIDICRDCDECVVKCVNGLNITQNIKLAKELFA